MGEGGAGCNSIVRRCGSGSGVYAIGQIGVVAGAIQAGRVIRDAVTRANRRWRGDFAKGCQSLGDNPLATWQALAKTGALPVQPGKDITSGGSAVGFGMEVQAE